MNAIEKLIDLLHAMRQAEGCAWTREQTFKSLAPQTLEETYELIEAIDVADPVHLKKELADMLYHVIFYCELAKENNWFNVNDVAQQMLDKLEQRMPPSAIRQQFDAELINQYWQKQKLSKELGILNDISKALPAMLYAQKLQEKAATVGFDWNDIHKVFDKLTEEVAELKEEINRNESQEKISAELGDILFTCINLGRHLGVSPEMALRATNSKFKQRFAYIEQQARAQNISLADMSLDEMEALWQAAK